MKITILHLKDKLDFESESPKIRDVFDYEWRPTIAKAKQFLRPEAESDPNTNAYFEVAYSGEFNDLEEAFAKTQNLDTPWTKNLGVAPRRSTSVGDVFLTENEAWIVDRFSFTQIY